MGAWAGMVLILGGLFFLVAHLKDGRQRSLPVEPAVAVNSQPKSNTVEVPAE